MHRDCGASELPHLALLGHMPRESAGKFLLRIVAFTDLLGGDVTDRNYRYEQLLIDPDFDLDALEPRTLIVGQFSGGWPHLTTFDGWTRRNEEGRYVQPGDPTECYMAFGLRVSRSERLYVFRILGVLVGEPRRIPMVG